MIHDLIKDKQFQELEKEYKLLSRARGESLDSLDYIVLDIETTGLEPTQHELTEIGALKIKGKELQNIFSTLIRPQNPISPEITRLTGIDNDMVKDSPSAREILPRFIEFAGSSILVVHNADFDIPFLKHHLKLLNDQEISNENICTVKTARYLLPELESYKLHSLALHFGIPVENRHRAVGDAELTYQIWIKFIDLLKEKGIANKRDLDSLISRL
jgi:DNA polymerase-3 subunit alpha (Gram-positive type)